MLANRVRIGVQSRVDKIPDIVINTPGGEVFLGGDMSAGFLGEVSQADFFAFEEIRRMGGSSTAQNQNESWLKFTIDDKVIYKSKKPIASNVTWKSLFESNCVYGDKIISKDGFSYKLRLLRGASVSPPDTEDGYSAKGSEYNRLILPIHARADIQDWDSEFVDLPTDNWGINYTDEDLQINTNWGQKEWTQDVYNNRHNVIVRGYQFAEQAIMEHALNGNAFHGWSPVLEVIK